MRPITFFFLLSFVFTTEFISAQSVMGKLTDKNTGEALIGVNISANNIEVALSDENGNYNLFLPDTLVTIKFSYIGFEQSTLSLEINNGQTLLYNIQMLPLAVLLDVYVVSGSLYEKKLTEETMSIEVIKKEMLTQTNATNLSDAILKAPGVYMMDEQANIRVFTSFFILIITVPIVF